MTREIPIDNWNEFLGAFSRKYHGRLARIETTAPLGEGGPLFEAYEPLRSVTREPDGSGKPAITMRLGALEQETPCLTHVITDPARLRVEEEPHGIALRLEIDTAEGDQTYLSFGPPVELPERMAPVGAGSYHGRDRLPPERL